jgi:hypothetical protein
MKYIKKPIAIEAITFDELVEHGKAEYARKGITFATSLPWSFEYANGSVTHENDDCYLINTLEGTMRFNRGDMLITGVQGEIYPCKADIFEATYEPVEVGFRPLDEPPAERPTFHQELVELINRHSMERYSGTPDWILGDMLMGVLRTYDLAMHYRERYYGRPAPFYGSDTPLTAPEEAPALTVEEQYRAAQEELKRHKESS